MLRELFVLGAFSIGAIWAVGSAFGALVLYLATAYFRPEQWVWSSFISTLNLSMLAGGVLILSTLIHERRVQFNAQTTIIAVFFMQTLLSTLMAENADWSWKYWTELAKVLVVVYLIPVIVTSPARLRGTFIAMTYALGFEAARQGWIGFFLGGADRNANIHPMMGDNNGVALSMMMLAPMLGALAQTSTRFWEKSLHRFMLVGCVLRGLLTYSRGGFITFGAITLYYIIRSKHRLRLIVMVFVAAIALAPMLPESFWDRMNTINAAPQERDESAQGRLHFWEIAVRMAVARPLTGVGVNGFQTSYDYYDISMGQFGHGRAVHSTWFGILSETGFVGFFLFVTVIFSAFAACIFVRRTGKYDPDAAGLIPYVTAIEATLLAYMVGGTFLNAQYFEMFWHVIGLATTAKFLAADARRVDSRERVAPMAGSQAGLVVAHQLRARGAR